ncbi:MAG: hypothetical protein ACK4ME_07740 [Fimbriimonadales bacterium]
MKIALKVLIGLSVVSVVACGGGGGGGGGAPVPTADATPPTIGVIAVQPELIAPDTQATIAVSISDDRSGVAMAQATITYPDNTQAGASLSLAQGVYQGSFQARWDGTAGQIRVRIRAMDQAGNAAEREISVNAIGTPPPAPF